VDGIFLGHNLLLSQASFFHDEIQAITEPSSRTFSFFTMELWLSRSLSHKLFLFSRWNSGYHEAFHTDFSSFFRMEFWLSRSLSHEPFFFFHDGTLAITKPFTRTFLLFSRWNSGNTRFGARLFNIYITKSIYIGSASLKTLPLDLEPPLQGKEYGPFILLRLEKVKLIFLPKSLIDT
jgi:hypothetical protein